MGYDLRMPLEEAMETQRAIRRLEPDPAVERKLARDRTAACPRIYGALGRRGGLRG